MGWRENSQNSYETFVEKIEIGDRRIDGGAAFFCALKAKGVQRAKPPALISFELLDHTGSVVSRRIPNFNYSEKYGIYLYLGERGEDGALFFDGLQLRFPPGLKIASIYLHRWGAKKLALVNRPRLDIFDIEVQPVVPEPIKLPEPPKFVVATPAPAPVPVAAPPAPAKPVSVWARKIDVSAVREVVLSTDLELLRESKGAPFVAAIRFWTAGGEVIQDPGSDIAYSKQFGSYFYFGPTRTIGKVQAKRRVIVPPNATAFSVELFPWGHSNARFLNEPKLAVEDAVRFFKGSEILAECVSDVLEGEAYDIEFVAECDQPTLKNSILAHPSFFDQQNRLLSPVGDVPVSSKVGGYRYLQATELKQSPTRVMQTSFVAPPGATRLELRVLRWKGSDVYRAASVQATKIRELVKVGGLQGLIDLPSGSGDVELVGHLKAVGKLRSKVGRLEIRFLDRNGKLLVPVVPGLETANDMVAYTPVVCRQLDGYIPINLFLKVPDSAAKVQWRSWPEEGVTLLAPEGLKTRRIPKNFSDFLREENIAERALDYINWRDYRTITSGVHANGFYASLIKKNLNIVGEAALGVDSQKWVRVSGKLSLQDFAGDLSRLMIYPMYFNHDHELIQQGNNTGCTLLVDLGWVRYASSNKAQSGEHVLSECFFVPPGAVNAVFYLVSKATADLVSITGLNVSGIEPDDVLVGQDVSLMDPDQVRQGMELAALTRDLQSRWLLSEAWAAHQKKDAKAALRASYLASELKELDLNWLPSLPLQARYESDSLSVMHLFKVIYPDESSGGAVRSTAIVEAQARQGLKPVVCMPLNSPRPENELPAQDGLDIVERNGVQICYPHFPGLNRKQIKVTDLLSLETQMWNQAVAPHQVSLIHAASGFRGYENAVKGLALARANDLPFVYEVRSFHEHTWRPLLSDHMGDRLTQQRTLQEDRCMAGADVVVTISKAMMVNLMERGVPRERLFFVPNAIDKAFEMMSEPQEVTQLRHKIGVLNKKTIGYISNFSQREGHRVLLDAFTKLRNQGLDIHLVIAGDGPEWSRIAQMVSERRLEQYVVMPGNVDHSEIRNWYHTIDLFVVPRIEDFASDYVTPLKPFEAMSQGIPVIMSDRPVTAEIAGDYEERARVFPAGDVDALAVLIASELSNPQQMKARADVARNWVMSERVWSSVVARYGDIYEAARRFHRDGKQGGAK
ncbi:glycosyltransferase [Alcaligenes faecalis]|uniref:glycosyltransferase family 4 protein n=1 Tax=Alcaligenes faecalis TaxID=511 RepID=UPI00137C2C90|nr:glycosyltransferase family 4 protein [Alcaligenes faecalis]QHS37843.1 glycosyltransferase [Alcaligenes faecalis]